MNWIATKIKLIFCINLFFSTISLLCVSDAHSIEFNYSILISSYQTVQVSVNINPLNTDYLTLYRIVANDQTALPPITSTQVTDSHGIPLIYTKSFIQQGEYILEKVVITTSNKSNASLTYSLNMTSPTYWWDNADSVIVAENQILFQPLPDETEVTKMTFSFSIPDNWRVITRLNPENSYYTANLSDTFQIALNQYRSIILGQPLAFGEFDVFEKKFGDIRSIAAYPRGDNKYMTDATYVEKIFDYQKTIMGNPSLGLGETSFLYIFHPDSVTINLNLIPTLGARGTFETVHTDEDRHLGHEMFHMWQGCGNSLPDAWRFLKIPCWWMEGGNEFLGVTAHLKTGAFTPEKEMEWRVSFFNTYKSVLLDTDKDIPVTNCGDLLPDDDAWFACHYSKSHSIIWLLDKILKRMTLQKLNIEGFMGFLFKNYTINADFLNSEDLSTAMKIYSGHDFETFFNLYVFGTEPLPLTVGNDELIVLWNKLPAELQRNFPSVPLPFLPILLNN